MAMRAIVSNELGILKSPLDALIGGDDQAVGIRELALPRVPSESACRGNDRWMSGNAMPMTALHRPRFVSIS